MIVRLGHSVAEDREQKVKMVKMKSEKGEKDCSSESKPEKMEVE